MTEMGVKHPDKIMKLFKDQELYILEIHSYIEILGQDLEEHEVIYWLNIDSTDRDYNYIIDDEL